MKTGIERLKEIAVPDTSWLKIAKYNENNKFWLNITFHIATKILIEIRKQNISKEKLSKGTKIKLETINKIGKGKYNLNLKQIGKIELFLKIKLINIKK